MAHALSPYSTAEADNSLSLHDQVQIALAIADETLVKSLLVDSLPSIALGHQIGGIRVTIGVPLESRQAVDGLIEFEETHCILIESPDEIEQGIAEYTQRNGNHRGYIDLTRCEAETRNLGQGIPLSQALSLLSHSGFTQKQIESILHLPQDGWFQSWWYMTDESGAFTVPFLRLLRTLHYHDGTVTIQYKDFFANEKPPCYKSQSQQVLVEIANESYNFSQTLEHINSARRQLGIQKAVLIRDRLSDLEARGYVSQGISLYTSSELVLPTQARCVHCVTADCPMHGRSDSPVLTCRRFCLDATPTD